MLNNIKGVVGIPRHELKVFFLSDV